MRYAMFMIADVFGTQAAHDMPSAQMIDKMTAYNAGISPRLECLRRSRACTARAAACGCISSSPALQTRDVLERGVDSSAIAHPWAQCCQRCPGTS